MADEILVLRGEGSVDVQIGGSGYAWNYLSACASMDGPSVPRGDTELRWCQDPQRAGKFKISSKIKTAPDQITFNIMSKLGKIDYLDGLECPFGLRARYAKCGEREDPSNYDPIMIAYCDVELTEHSYEDLVAVSPDNEDEILVTAAASASYEYRVKKMNAARIGTAADLGDQPVNDIEFCDSADCGGYCGDRTDGCSIAWGVTDIDVTPYAAPNIIKYVKNTITGAITWTLAPVLGFNNNLEGVECAGSRLIVSSNGDSAIGYNDNNGDQDSWNVVALGNAPAANPNALFARTAREIWVGCANGYIYKSVNGGATWTAMHEGVLTAQTINAVFAYDGDLVYAVGNASVILKSEDGGATWDDITETATMAGNLLDVEAPRPNWAYVSTNAGQIFYSTDEGDTWTEYAFDGSGVGTVDDIEFCGPCGSDVMFILHNDAGPRGRILRDLSGGAGGADVETVAGYTDVIAAGVELNALACCGVNEILVGGENSGAYPTIIRAS